MIRQLLYIIPLFLFTNFSFAQEKIYSTELKPFSKLKVSFFGKVHIYKSETVEVSVNIEDKFKKYFHVEVRQDTLSIYFSKNLVLRDEVKDINGELKLGIPYINLISINELGSLIIENISNDIKIEGTLIGLIDILNCSTEKIDFKIGTMGYLKFTGNKKIISVGGIINELNSLNISSSIYDFSLNIGLLFNINIDKKITINKYGESSVPTILEDYFDSLDKK